MYVMPEEKWKALDPSTRHRIQLEEKIVKALVDLGLNAGLALSVYDGEELAPRCSTDRAAIMDALLNTDDDRIYYHKAGNPKYWGWVQLVYGNSGWDVISDYTTNLEDFLKPVFAMAEAAEQ